MTTPPAAVSEREQERVPPQLLKQVQELLRLFGRAARAHQLYLPNNPVYRSAHDALRAGFLPIWEMAEDLVLSFTESEVKFRGVTVLEERTKGSDSLPWLFFKDGVRELRLRRGFEDAELEELLQIMQRVRHASPDEDDLLTLLWQGDFNFLRYQYVDVSMESASSMRIGVEALTGHETLEAGETRPTTVDTGTFTEGSDEEEGTRAGVVSMADFDSTLYFLDEKEIDYLQAEVRREYETDLRQNVAAILLDIFEQQPAPEIRNEVADALDAFMLSLLSAGQFQNVAFIIREAQLAVERAVDLQPAQRERLLQLPARLSSPEALTQLLQSIDEAPVLPPTNQLMELFDQLRGDALSTVLEWLGKLQNLRVRPLLEEAASRLASQNTAELVKLIASPSRTVALEAARRAGVLKTIAAVDPLARLLAAPDVEMRIAAVAALAEIASPTALQGLEQALEDSDRDVRVSTVRALQARAYRPALPRLEGIVKGRAIRDADLSEKMAVFEAYGSLCGESGVAPLDALLNGRSLFGRRDDAELRACAAVALGRIGTPPATAALQRAAAEKDVVVRMAVTRALRGVPA